VRRHLNNGVLPENSHHYREQGVWNRHAACPEALCWLEKAKPAITNLADAWERAPRPDWLVWAISNLNPSKKDVVNVIKASRKVGAYCYSKKGGFLLDPSDLRVFNRLLAEAVTQVGWGNGWRNEGTTGSLVVINYRIFGPWFDDNWVCPDKKKLPKMRARARHAANIFRKHIPNPWR
jgi:hypothetical protein